MKKLLMRVICLMIPVGIVVSAVNAVVDPAALFIRGRDIYELAEYMCGGGIVVGNSNINERELLRSIIKAQEKEPDIIAVGSSRIMYVDGSLVARNVKQGSFRNHGLSGGGLYDCIAVVGAYDAYGGSLPKTVIIGADPWLFDRYDPGDRYSEMAEEIAHMQDVIAGVENTGRHSIWQKWRQQAEKLIQLFSVTYFQSSLKYAINNGSLLQKQYSYADSEDETDGALRRADGSIRSALDYMNRSSEEVSADVNWRVALKEINRTSYYPDLDKSMQKEFEDFVEYL